MLLRRHLRTVLIIALFLAGIAAQAARFLTPFGLNVNFFMAWLPSLAFAVSPGVYALTAVAAIVFLKTTPAFEIVSLAFGGIAIFIYIARRLPLHPFILHPALSIVASAAFYGIMDQTFFLSHTIALAEFSVTALLSLAFILFVSYAK